VGNKLSFTQNETKELCKKVVFDYIKGNMSKTSFENGLNCDITNYEDTNIDNWFNNQQI